MGAYEKEVLTVKANIFAIGSFSKMLKQFFAVLAKSP
jgi:hypothetical protein